MNAQADSVAQLCPKCGLCCDGTLFADVELQKGDDAGRLVKLGLSLKKKGVKRVFVQPCTCFDGRFCNIYGERPKHCRLFECGLLKKVQAGEIPTDAALKTISEAKKLAERVRQLLHQLGQRDEQKALTHRYAEAMSAPMDLTKDDADARGELMLAVNNLMQTFQREFLA